MSAKKLREVLKGEALIIDSKDSQLAVHDALTPA
jgi:hypothetical protein